jgi:hypothetical protein
LSLLTPTSTGSGAPCAPAYIVFIATSDFVIDQFTQEGRPSYAWYIQDYAGEDFAKDSSALSPARKGRHIDELVPRLTEAISKLPQNSEVYVVSDVKFFTDLINNGVQSRKSSGYRRTNSRTPLAYADEWRSFDNIQLEKNLCISAGLPRSEGEKKTFDRLKEWASECAKNISVRPKFWGLR